MNEKIRGIVLDVKKHSDKVSIVTLYTRSRGRLSFVSPLGSGKSGKMRQARLQPLAVIETDINYKPVAELQRLGSFSLYDVWGEIYFDPVKRLVALFLGEFLNRLLRATMPDENTWDYIYNSLRLFDKMHSGVADFHITFLSSLLPFAGIQPDGSEYRNGYFFDMQAGVFTDSRPPHPDFLGGADARLAALLCRVNYATIRALHLNGSNRNEILREILHYYAIHFPGTSGLQSLDIIHDIFS